MPRQSRAGFKVLLILAAIAHPLPPLAAEPAAFAQTPPAPAQPKKNDDATPAVQVRGKVVDRQGNGLTNIEVTIEGPKGPATKKTGAGGTFSFEGPPGKYKISAKSGTRNATMEVAVTKSMDLAELVLNTEQ